LYTSCVLGLRSSARFLYNITYPKNILLKILFKLFNAISNDLLDKNVKSLFGIMFEGYKIAFNTKKSYFEEKNIHLMTKKKLLAKA
jgi:hypothetical protein